jgi:predicted metal-dependent hydrolase
MGFVPSSIRKSERQKTIRVPDAIARGVDEFNTGQYFECHETFEEVWQHEPGSLRDFYKGLIQVAAGFVHAGRANARGAVLKLTSGSDYLEGYRPAAMGINVNAAIAQAREAAAQIEALGPASLRRETSPFAPRWTFDDTALTSEAVRWRAWGFDARGAPMDMEITVFE